MAFSRTGARESSLDSNGTRWLSAPFEVHPLKMANQLLTLNEFSGGRANIVVGGRRRYGHCDAYQARSLRRCMPAHGARRARMRRVSQVGRSPPTDPLTFAGEVFKIDATTGRAWADRYEPPHIYVGATKPQMLRMAAQVADGVMFSDLTLGRLDETMGITQRRGHSRPPGAPHETNFASTTCSAGTSSSDRREAAVAEARRKLWVRGMLDHVVHLAGAGRARLPVRGGAHAVVHSTPISMIHRSIEGVPDELVDINSSTNSRSLATSNDVDALIERFWQASGKQAVGDRCLAAPCTTTPPTRSN